MSDFPPEGSEQWGKECDSQTGLCFNSAKTNYCTGQQPCSGGGVGDINITSKSPRQIAASKTKFWGTYTGEGYLKLIGVGMLADAGLEAGDLLTGVFVVGDYTLEMSEAKDRQKIL